MADLLTNNQIKQFKSLISEVIDEKFGENILERIDTIQNNTDATAKMITDDRDELEITKGRVSNHEVRILSLESACAN
jgi:phosphoenolpyruvate carboxylase